MSKATHIGTVIKLDELISLPRACHPTRVTKSYMNDVFELCGKDIEITFDEDHQRWVYEELYLSEDYFTDLKPIKPVPVIEIPKGDKFWFTYEDDLVYEASLLECGLYKIRWKGDMAGRQDFSRGRIFDNLNRIRNAWIICEEPKKAMRPFTDEEWREWFDDGGICSSTTCRQRAQKISTIDEREFIFFHRWLSKEYFLNAFTDRHGNRFEKENL